MCGVIILKINVSICGKEYKNYACDIFIKLEAV